MNPNVDMNRIYYFIKIVDAGNLTKASEALNEPKAKLSRNLALLEEELKLQLVYRTTRQFKLTAAGKQLYDHAKTNIEGVLNSINNLKNQDEEFSGSLKITAPEDIGLYVLTKVVDEFSKMHPKISFELIYTNQILDIVKEGIDIAIRVGNLKDSSLIQKRAASIEFVLVSSPKYLSQNPPLTECADLESHSTIGFINQQWKLSNKNKQISVKPKHKYTLNNFMAIRDLVINGHGIALLPQFVCKESIESGDLVSLLKQWTNQGPTVHAIIPQQKNVSKKVKAFFNYAATRIGDLIE